MQKKGGGMPTAGLINKNGNPLEGTKMLEESSDSESESSNSIISSNQDAAQIAQPSKNFSQNPPLGGLNEVPTEFDK